MGLLLGSVTNIGYATAAENDAVDGANWLLDREAGLRASDPLLLQLLIAGLYGTVGLLAMTAVLTIPSPVYKIGHPILLLREEAVIDAQLNTAVDTFTTERILVYG